MTDDSNHDEAEQTDEEELSLPELHEKKEEFETRNFPTDHIDEQIAEKERKVELAEERVELQESLEKARSQGDTASAEVLEERIAEIDEMQAAPLREKIEEKRRVAEEAERMAETAEKSGWGDAAVESFRERAENAQAEAETLEREIDDRGSPEALSDDSSTVDWGASVPDITREDPVKVDAYLEEIGTDRSEIKPDRIETLANASLRQTRDKARILKAAKDGRAEVEADELELRSVIAMNHGI